MNFSFFARIVATITRHFHPRGTQRFLRFFFPPETTHIKTTVPYKKNLRIKIDTSSYVEWDLFFRGEYEENVARTLKRFIKEGDVVVDVGAYIGTHTLLMASLVGDMGKVYAFEPNLQIQKKLSDNITLNDLKNVKIESLALSFESGRMNFFSGENLKDTGTSSLYALDGLKQSYQVEVTILDQFIKKEDIHKLDLIKIDTRGSDLPIIKGASEVVTRFRPYIIFEYNKNNWSYSNSLWAHMRDFFFERNYKLYLIGRKDLIEIEKEPTIQTSHNILAFPR